MTAAQRRRRRQARSGTQTRPRLIGYTRVSSQEQAEHVSLRDQAERIEAYGKANGCDIVRIEADRGVSGFKKPEDRPAMRRALAAVEAGEADGIVAIALDRLSRNAIATMELVEESERSGWRLVAMDLALDTGTSTGKMVATVLAAVAQMYRDQISERTSSALAKLAREGMAVSRHVPFGYVTANGSATASKGGDNRLVAQPEEQRTLKKMLRMRARGAGPTAIAQKLNGEGQLTRSGSEWTRQAVHTTIERHLDREEVKRAIAT